MIKYLLSVWGWEVKISRSKTDSAEKRIQRTVWKSSAANNSDHVSNSDQNLNSKLSISYSNLVIMIFTFKFHKIKQCLYVGALILNHISRI